GKISVADANNAGIEKLALSSIFLGAMGIKGTGFGQLGAPNGIAVDKAGNIYVADATRHRVEKLAPDGNVIDEWKGPAPGFYGPRGIAIAPAASIYVFHQ